MPRKQRARGTVTLPKGVHRVIAGAREYFYFQIGRGTSLPGPRIRLPNDVHMPEFWQAIQQARGVTGVPIADDVNSLADAYLCSQKFLGIAESTQYQYRHNIKIVRAAWGALPVEGLRPKHVQEMMESLAPTPSKANAFLTIMRVMSGWALARGLIDHSLIEGVELYERKGGHEPWTDAQIAAARSDLSPMIRRGIMLYLYTGQRGSDIVRLGWTDVDEGGFKLRQRKTGREVWCPIVPELAAEMATWERRPGPFVTQATGKPYTRKHFWKHFDEERQNVLALAKTTLHGLRCTAVVRLRRAGLSTGQIGDIVGMSLSMIERYCRFADRKISGQAALIRLAEHSSNANVKTGKQ